MKINVLLLVLAGTLLCFPLFSLQIKSGTEALYTEEGNFDEDYIFTGSELVFNGSAVDLFFVGRKLILEGNTSSGLYAVGETIKMNGTIENDFLGGARLIEINGRIKGTLFLSSGECVLSEDSVIDGNLFITSGNVKLYGTINGNVYAGAGVIIMNGVVNGNVEAGVGEISIMEKGRVNGNLTYYSDNRLSEREEQRISGQVTQRKDKTFDNRKNLAVVSIVLTLLGFLSILVTGLLILLLPAMKNFNYAGSHKQFWYYVVWGLIPFFIYPMLIVVSMVLVIIIPLGIILLLAGIPLIFITHIIGITAFGQYLFRLFKWDNNNRFLYFLFGFVFYIIIGLIPLVKVLGIIFFSCIGWGIILEKVFKKRFTNNDVLEGQG